MKKNILLIGTSRGLGKGIYDYYKNENYNVFLSTRKTKTNLKKDTAKIYSKPTFRSDNTAVSPKGITPQPKRLSKKVITGARIKIITLALLGKIDSLINNSESF